MHRPIDLPDTFQPMRVASGIRASLGRDPGKTALICGERLLSYAALDDRMTRLGALANGFGLARGDRVAIIAGNCLEYIEIVAGLSEVGLAVATLNPRQTPAELGYILEDCGARIAFVAPEYEEVVRAADARCLERIVVLGAAYEELLARANPGTLAFPPVEEWDPFALVYTSGTTGRPRGVTLPHRSRVATFFGMAVEYGCYAPTDRYLAIAPMFNGAGYAFAHATVFFGGTCEILPRFEPEIAIRLLHETRAAGTFMVPTHFHATFALGKSTLERYRGTGLKALVSNAAPLPQRTKELIVDYFGNDVLHETYGSTEAAIVTNLRPPYQLSKQQCIGQPFAMNEVKLLDRHGEPVERGEVGELFSLSPTLFSGYWNQPEASAAARRGAWVSAGDLARQDEDGFYYLVDRKKDMYISGGANVYPREIEEFLFRLPGVKEAAVVGVPDAYWGEAGKAFVVLAEGATLSPAAIVGACKTGLAGYKVPKHVAVIEALPRNAAGKVLKTELRTRD